MYPMTFTFLFSKNYIVQNEPCLIHRIENEMDWGDYNHYDKFYLNRLLMYQISFDNKFINHKEYYLLSKRLKFSCFQDILYLNLNFLKLINPINPKKTIFAIPTNLLIG